MPTIELDIGIAMGSEVDNKGHLSVQIDGYGEGQAGVAPYEVQAIGGILRRPLDPVVDGEGNPDPTKACPTMYGMEGGRGHAFPLLDPRTVAKMPVIQKGEALVPGDAGQFIRFHVDGATTTMTTDAAGDPSGNAVYFRVKPDGLEFVAPWGTLTFDASGFHVDHPASGAKLHLGYVGGLPAPLDAVGSYVTIEGGVVSINGAMVSVGPDGAADSAVKATPLLAYLAQMAAGINSLAAAVGSFSGAGTFPALPAVVTQLAALTTPPLTIQSSTTVT